MIVNMQNNIYKSVCLSSNTYACITSNIRIELLPHNLQNLGF